MNFHSTPSCELILYKGLFFVMCDSVNQFAVACIK